MFRLLKTLALTSAIGLAGLTVQAPAQAQVGPVLDRVVFHGRAYCYYPDGWHGPGWYWCGYAFRRGLGWGGPDGWRGFFRGRGRFGHGGRGRFGYGGRVGGRFGHHGGMAGGHRGRMGGHGGHMGGGRMGGGHMGGGHMGGGHMGGGHMGGGHGGGHGGHR